MNDLNKEQQKVVDTTEGFVAVDAGPGTGKTATVTERCLRILENRDVSGGDVIMLTFTKNAVAEMKDRIIGTVSDRLKAQNEGRLPRGIDYETMLKKSKEMFVGTFDSFSLSIVTQYPTVACHEIGVKSVPGNHPDISNNKTIDDIYFSRFLSGYLRYHDAGRYSPVFSADANSLSNLLSQLLSQCIIPKANGGWFFRSDFIDCNERDHLLGDKPKLKELVRSAGIQNVKKYVIPNDESIDVDTAVDDPSQKELVAAVHDLFLAFIERSVLDNHMSFGLIKCLALITLYSIRRADLRSFSYKYVIIDEFQDTNFTEMSIALLILQKYRDNLNLCVVGDWKQGIYEFKYADIGNLLRFYDNIAVIKRRLGKAIASPSLVPEEGEKHILRVNYRSSQLIIDCAYKALGIPIKNKGGGYSEKDTGTLEACPANRMLDKYTKFERMECPEGKEPDGVTLSIFDYVNSEKYMICRTDPSTEDRFRPPRYGDIAVLCPNNKQCMTVKAALDRCGIPAYINGKQEVMASKEAKILLAWLRYVENKNDPFGYVPILAFDSYSPKDIKAIKGRMPEKMVGFRKELLGRRKRITGLISSVFEHYGMDNDVTQEIISIIASLHRENLMTIADVINLIESDIERGAAYPVDNAQDGNSVVIQTIHQSKGLEYPIVLIPFVDYKRGKGFPKTSNPGSIFSLDDTAGLRCTKTVITENGHTWEVSDWKDHVIKDATETGTDIANEQRRLFFVAISRAKQYVKLISSDPSDFFTGFDDAAVGKPEMFDEGRKLPDLRDEMKKHIEKPQVPEYRPRRVGIGVHNILHLGTESDDSEDLRYCEDDRTTKGVERGTEVHLRAQRIVEGSSLPQSEIDTYPELKNVIKVVKGLPNGDVGLRRAEIECYLPVNSRRPSTLRGVIDMLYADGDVIEVHDWKTDKSDGLREEYKVQLSIYAYAASMYYERTSGRKRKLRCIIDWLNDSNPSFPRTEFDPVPMEEIVARVDDYLDEIRR